MLTRIPGKMVGGCEWPTAASRYRAVAERRDRNDCAGCDTDHRRTCGSLSNAYIMSAVSTRIMRSTEDRYRTLLDASSTLADQPTIKAVLHSLRDVLSSTSRLHGTELYVLNDEQDSLRVLEFDRDPDAPAFKIGTKVSRIGAAARVLEEQKPVFLPDVSQEMLKHPELAPFAAEAVGRTAYLFPVSTAQKRYGFLAVTK